MKKVNEEISLDEIVKESLISICRYYKKNFDQEYRNYKKMKK